MAPIRPVIGDFRPTNRPVEPRKVEPVDDEKAVPIPQEPDLRSTDEVVEKTIAEMKSVQDEDSNLTPPERYQKRLKNANISIEEATNIYDAILSKGYFEQYVRLGKTGARAVFRTRLYEDSLRVQTALEVQKPQLVITQDELITRYNLAASLYEWQGKAIAHETDSDFDVALKIVRRLPGPVYALLATELMKFDQKVMTIFSDGASENFS